MNAINAIKIGNTINVSINGILNKKTFVNENEATETYLKILDYKINPTDNNIKEIQSLLNEKKRISYITGFDLDENTGELFLNGFNTPIPNDLIDVINEYHKNGYPMKSIINFWKLLMLNPDIRIRESLFKFIRTHDFVLTDNGYLLVYKAVTKKNINPELNSFIGESMIKVKGWKKNPNNYIIYQTEDEYYITKKETIDNWNLEEKNIIIIGNLFDCFNDAINPTYTDKRTESMKIEIGKPVKMDRINCDSDPSVDCSFGLHVGATRYVENFAKSNDEVLICLVNPMNIVAIPNYDHSKMRVSEYFPIGIANYSHGKIEIVSQLFYENDYVNVEEKELALLLEKAIKNEPIFDTDEQFDETIETRSFEELIKIIETRIIDLSEI
jgi:hypothetical protein